MDFGEALRALKTGRRATRTTAWIHGAFLILVPGSTVTVKAGRPLAAAAPHLAGRPVAYQGHIDVCDTGFVPGGTPTLGPWTATGEDLLAEDWAEVTV